MTPYPSNFDLTEPDDFNFVRSALLRVYIEHAIRGSDAGAATFLEERITAGAWALAAETDENGPTGAVRVLVEHAPLVAFDVDEFNTAARRMLELCPELVERRDFNALYQSLLDATDELARNFSIPPRDVDSQD